MNCSIFEERIGLYAGGDLDAGEVRVVEAHLKSCQACAELAAGLASDAANLAAEPAAAATADFAAMRRQIRAGILREKRRKVMIGMMLAAAAIILVIAATATRTAPHSPERAQVQQPAPLVAPPAPPVLSPRPAKAVRPRRRPAPAPDPALEAALRQFVEAQEAAAVPPPSGQVVPTKNPDVVLMLLEPNGGPDE